jgi:predicted nucleotidyltransferase
MRITEAQRRAVVAAAKRRFGQRAQVWLFGSRADDSRRGGDVDLYVEAETVPEEGRVPAEIRAGVALEAIFEGGSVDLLVRYPGEAEDPIHRIAKSTGTLL